MLLCRFHTQLAAHMLVRGVAKQVSAQLSLQLDLHQLHSFSQLAPQATSLLRSDSDTDATESAAKPLGELTTSVAKPIGVPFNGAPKPLGVTLTLSHQRQTQSQHNMHAYAYSQQLSFYQEQLEEHETVIACFLAQLSLGTLLGPDRLAHDQPVETTPNDEKPVSASKPVSMQLFSSQHGSTQYGLKQLLLILDVLSVLPSPLVSSSIGAICHGIYMHKQQLISHTSGLSRSSVQLSNSSVCNVSSCDMSIGFGLASSCYADHDTCMSNHSSVCVHDSFCMPMHTLADTYTPMHILIDIQVYVSMHMCMYLHMHIHAYMHGWACSHIAHIYAYEHAHKHKCEPVELPPPPQPPPRLPLLPQSSLPPLPQPPSPASASPISSPPLPTLPPQPFHQSMLLQPRMLCGLLPLPSPLAPQPLPLLSTFATPKGGAGTNSRAVTASELGQQSSDLCMHMHDPTHAYVTPSDMSPTAPSPSLCEASGAAAKPIGELTASVAKPVGVPFYRVLKPVGVGLTAAKPLGVLTVATTKPVGELVAVMPTPVGGTSAAAKPVGELTVATAKPIGEPLAVTAKPVGVLITAVLKPLGETLASHHQLQVQSQHSTQFKHDMHAQSRPHSPFASSFQLSSGLPPSLPLLGINSVTRALGSAGQDLAHPPSSRLASGLALDPASMSSSLPVASSSLCPDLSKSSHSPLLHNCALADAHATIERECTHANATEPSAKAMAHIYVHELEMLEADYSCVDAEYTTLTKALQQLQLELEASVEREHLLTEAAAADRIASADAFATHAHALSACAEASEASIEALERKLTALDAECAYVTAERTANAKILDQLRSKLNASVERECVLAETAAADRIANAQILQQLQLACSEWKEAHGNSERTAQQFASERNSCMKVIVEMWAAMLWHDNMHAHATLSKLCAPHGITFRQCDNGSWEVFIRPHIDDGHMHAHTCNDLSY
jgi:hypothetical protein